MLPLLNDKETMGTVMLSYRAVQNSINCEYQSNMKAFPSAQRAMTRIMTQFYFQVEIEKASKRSVFIIFSKVSNANTDTQLCI